MFGVCALITLILFQVKFFFQESQVPDLPLAKCHKMPRAHISWLSLQKQVTVLLFAVFLLEIQFVVTSHEHDPSSSEESSNAKNLFGKTILIPID